MTSLASLFEIVLLFSGAPGKCLEVKNAGKECSFELFVTEMIKLYDRTKSMNGHWERQFKLCDPCHYNYSYIGKL